jgi:cell division protein FtsL
VRRPRTFVALWTLATTATVSAFVLHLALRGRIVSTGYDLGRARAEQARLREIKRVLEVEAASYKTPERVEIVARSLLAMEPPPPDRIVSLPAVVELPDRKREALAQKTAEGSREKP